MATSGRADGPPEIVRLPVIEMFTGIDAATAILAALRVREEGGPAQSIDAAMWDTNASLLGTFVAQATSGKGAGYRDGARHSICAPWNAYAARDGFVMICTSSDAHWQRLLDLMQRPDAAADPRFADMASRRKHIADVDALVASWTATRTVENIVALLRRDAIPAGAISPALDGSNRSVAQPLKLSRTPLRQADNTDVTAAPDWKPRSAGAAREQGAVHPPLTNIRVVEIGPFTAGPLTGRSLGDLGADVVKVEPLDGEVSRSWSPRAGHISGYFANYNAGKSSVALDLSSEAGRTVFERLLRGADVLVENLKAGALAKLGFGAEAVRNRHPRLIYCSISGYGRDGAQDAALDTVIQAQSGIMSLVGRSSVPCKLGFSVADLIAGHLAPLGIIAALRARDRDGIGQHVDISMLGALQWVIQMSGAGAHGGFDEGRCIESAGGWILCLPGKGDEPGRELRVRDLGEVFADPSLRARGMLLTVPTSAGAHGHDHGLAVCIDSNAATSRENDRTGRCGLRSRFGRVDGQPRQHENLT